MQTPLKEEIKKGTELTKTMKSMQTPLKEEIKRGTELTKNIKSTQTPLKQEIKKGTELNSIGKDAPEVTESRVESVVQKTPATGRKSVRKSVSVVENISTPIQSMFKTPKAGNTPRKRETETLEIEDKQVEQQVTGFVQEYLQTKRRKLHCVKAIHLQNLRANLFLKFRKGTQWKSPTRPQRVDVIQCENL